ncbi:MAG: hypothetical protein AAF772_01430 [Acidobacteriota bacterium]
MTQTPTPPDGAVDPDTQRLQREALDYYFAVYLDELAASGDDSGLVACLDEGYVAEQARYTQSLKAPARVLQDVALPAAQRLGDAERFVTCAASLLNIMRLGDALAETGLLDVIAQVPWSPAIEALVEQIVDPYASGRAYALALRVHDRDDRCARWRVRAIETFDTWVKAGCPAYAVDSMAIVVRAVGAELSSKTDALFDETLGSWPTLHAAAALALLDRDALAHPHMIEHVVRVDPGAIAGLADALVAHARRRRRDHLPHWLADVARRRPAIGWPLWAAVYARAVDESSALPDADGLLDVARAQQMTIPACVDLLWQARRLVAAWPEAMPDHLAKDPAAGAIWTLIAARGAPRGLDAEMRTRVTSALAPEVDLDPARWLRLAIHLAAALAEDAASHARRWLSTILASVHVVAPSTDDLLRLFDVAQRLDPAGLPITLRRVFTDVPSEARLLDVAARVEVPAVIDALIDDAESLALVVSENEVESLSVRRRLLENLLCGQLEGAHASFDGVAFVERLAAIRRRLLREEWDQLIDRHGGTVTCPRRGEKLLLLLDPDRHARTMALLSLRRDLARAGTIAWSHEDEPYAPLLRAVFASTRVIDELEAMRLLVGDDRDVDRLVTHVRDEPIRQLALLRHARRALVDEHATWLDMADGERVVTRVQRAFVLSSRARMLDLLPRLVEIGGLFAITKRIDEAIEAAYQSVQMRALPTRARLDAIAQVVIAIFDALATDRDTTGRQATRAIARLMRALVQLTVAWPTTPGVTVSDDAAVPWLPCVRLWPLLIAGAEAVVGDAAWARHAPNARSWFSGRRAATVADGFDALVTRVAGRGAHAADARWRALRALCHAAPDARAEMLAMHAAPAERDDDEWTGAALVLLTPHAPARAFAQLENRVPPGAARDDLLERMAWLTQRSRATSFDAGAAVTKLASRSAVELPMRLRTSSATRDDARLWQQAIARGAIDPADPAAEPLLRRLRRDPPLTRRAMEQAIIDAGRAGPDALERALRLYWHHALGTPGQLDDPAAWDRLRQALGRGRDLSGVGADR